MTRTRSTKKEIEDDCVENVDEITESKTTIPSDDLSVSIKLAVANGQNFANSNIVSLPHPRSGKPALFRLGEDYCDEVLQVDDPHRSLFFGNTITGDGRIILCSPYHPLFIALPYLYTKKEMFLEAIDLFADENFPALNMILSNKQFKNTLEKVADVKDVCDTTVVRFNEEKCMSWISGRYQIFYTYFKESGGLHSSVLEDQDALSRYVFTVLCEYISESMSAKVKNHLNIPEAPEGQTRMETEAPIKRKADDESLLLIEKPAKRQKESVVKKQLQQASKGTRNISSFFAKKN